MKRVGSTGPFLSARGGLLEEKQSLRMDTQGQRTLILLHPFSYFSPNQEDMLLLISSVLV